MDTDLFSLPKPLIKLFTWWMPNGKNLIIPDGIWETISVSGIDNKRNYVLRCICSFDREIKQGDKINHWEEVIILLCHQVKIEHLPKIDHKQWRLTQNTN